MSSRSDTAYGYWRDASEKFDYFVTGLTGALVAYVGQNLKPVRVGLNPQTVELAALAVLVASVVVGLKRIEVSIQLYKVQHGRLYHEEARGAFLDASQRPGQSLNVLTGDVVTSVEAVTRARGHHVQATAAGDQSDELVKIATSRYHWRNGLLLVGFAALVAARILPAYVR